MHDSAVSDAEKNAEAASNKINIKYKTGLGVSNYHQLYFLIFKIFVLYKYVCVIVF